MKPEKYVEPADCYEQNWNSDNCGDCSDRHTCEDVDDSITYSRCGYWRIPRSGRKCGQCDACADEGDAKHMAWKDGD